MVFDYATNVQTDTSFHNKTQNDKQEDQSNKGVHKKSMIQQTLPQSYNNIRNRLRSVGESIPDRDLINDAKATETSKQIIYNPQKKNEDTSWIEVSEEEKSELPRNDNVTQTTKEERTSIKQTCDYSKLL